MTSGVNGINNDVAGKCPNPKSTAARILAAHRATKVGYPFAVLLIIFPSQANKESSPKRNRISSSIPP
jgi:hypothetical protein